MKILSGLFHGEITWINSNAKFNTKKSPPNYATAPGFFKFMKKFDINFIEIFCDTTT